MVDTVEHWTRAHDLALMFLSGIHGGKRRLSDHDVERVVEAVRSWNEHSVPAEEIVLEALLVYSDEGSVPEVLERLAALPGQLSGDEQDEVIQSLLWAADVGARLTAADFDLVGALAGLLCPKVRPVALHEEGRLHSGAWSTFHDMTLLYLMAVKSRRHVPSPKELASLKHVLRAWLHYPELISPERILHEVLEARAQETGGRLLPWSVERLAASLGGFQRMALLADVWELACVEEASTAEVRLLIASVADAWTIRPGLPTVATT